MAKADSGIATEAETPGDKLKEAQAIQRKKNQMKLSLRYCNPQEVNAKRQKALQIKATFLAKLNYMK